MIDAREEGGHPAGLSPRWRESYQFSFADMSRGVVGRAEIHFQPRAKRLSASYIIQRRERIALFYRPLVTNLNTPWHAFQVLGDCRASALDLRMVAPLGPWKVHCHAPIAQSEMEFTPASKAFPLRMRTAAEQGYQQFGKMRGWFEEGLERCSIDALARREHSWGIVGKAVARDRLHFQLGEIVCDFDSQGASHVRRGGAVLDALEARIELPEATPFVDLRKRAFMFRPNEGAPLFGWLRPHASFPWIQSGRLRTLSLCEIEIEGERSKGIGILERSRAVQGIGESLQVMRALLDRGADLPRTWLDRVALI